MVDAARDCKLLKFRPEESATFVVIEQERRVFDALRADGIPAVYGDASAHGVLEAARVSHARLAVIATADVFQARRILEISRKLNPNIKTIVRTHSEAEFRFLKNQNVTHVVMGERELALSMLKCTLDVFGVQRELSSRADLS